MSCWMPWPGCCGDTMRTAGPEKKRPEKAQQAKEQIDISNLKSQISNFL